MNLNKNELSFEKELIEYLTNIGGVKQWEYLKHIKTTQQLWENFKDVLERNNSSKLDTPLTETEFNQVKRVISNISTPYKAGQFLYGTNGISEVEVLLDNGKRVFLMIFDQDQIGGGSTVYQIVNQIKRERVVDGKTERIFDVTLLINGLPIIQIELKRGLNSAGEALNQMKQYIDEKQYTDIFSTLQILIAMTPYDIRYMANTQINQFNALFAFNWQNEKDAMPVRSWKEFSDKVLSIPMAHELSTRFMILDGTKNKESLKVMRPYQVYATKRVLEKIQKYDFKYDDGKLGYIWHTTGSGKTITSFKTAWLASRLSNVDKVIFLVDRIALTNQTTDAYKAYDPIAGFEGKDGIVSDTSNVKDLYRKLNKKSDKNIIVTSIQKMAKYATKKEYKNTTQRILFIVDEAHRSTGNTSENESMLESIRNALPTSAWIGYTGTPKFPETYHIFGELLHAYTIKEAIADGNVLGFKVEFKETIKVQDDPTLEDIDDAVKSSVYDTSEEHVKIVVDDILNNWNSRSNNRKYNAMLSVHVGGNRSSSTRVIEYFNAFQKAQESKPNNERLKIAISYSLDTSNGDNQLDANRGLHEAIIHYNNLFGTNWDMKTIRQYSDDLASRLNKSVYDGKYLDLVIVIDQLLTGFDAPELNTLYLDRTLKGGNLIQAYSRTNRIHNRDDKPHGNVVNYRWPVQNEEQMNKSFAIYSNRDSSIEQLTLEELKKENITSGILAKPYEEVINDMKMVIRELETITCGFKVVPPSEKTHESLLEKLREYNTILSQLKQYPYEEKTESGFPIEKELYYSEVGITEDDEMMINVIARELKEKLAKKEDIDISQIDLVMTHVNEVEINYDYLVELIAQMADEVYENKMDRAINTRIQITQELTKTKDDKEVNRINDFVDRIYDKSFEFESYPAPRDKEKMYEAMGNAQTQSIKVKVASFIHRWGLAYAITPDKLENILIKHRKGHDDLDKQGVVTDSINQARTDYQDLADEEVARLSWIQYRTQLKMALVKLADDIKENE